MGARAVVYGVCAAVSCGHVDVLGQRLILWPSRCSCLRVGTCTCTCMVLWLCGAASACGELPWPLRCRTGLRLSLHLAPTRSLWQSKMRRHGRSRVHSQHSVQQHNRITVPSVLHLCAVLCTAGCTAGAVRGGHRHPAGHRLVPGPLPHRGQRAGGRVRHGGWARVGKGMRQSNLC